MTTAHHRKKQPELVKMELLNAAMDLGVEKGLTSITVQAVAERAGVTKGGLLHHFPSKQELIDGVFHHLMEILDQEINGLMEKDSETYGRFTRAYIKAMLSDQWSKNQNPAGSPRATLTISTITDPHLRQLWEKWFRQHLLRHKSSDSGPELEIARLAADGAWLYLIDQSDQSEGLLSSKLRDKLIAMTVKK